MLYSIVVIVIAFIVIVNVVAVGWVIIDSIIGLFKND